MLGMAVIDISPNSLEQVRKEVYNQVVRLEIQAPCWWYIWVLMTVASSIMNEGSL
jgi:hypothetical protein